MSFSEREFLDKNNEIVKPQELLKKHPEASRYILNSALCNAFFSTARKIKDLADEGRDYSENVKFFKDCVNFVRDYEGPIVQDNGELDGVISLMETAITSEKFVEFVKPLRYFEYADYMNEIEKKVSKILNIKERSLSEEDKEVAYDLYNATHIICFDPDFTFPDSEVDIKINKDGVFVNGEKSNVDIKNAQSNKREILKKLEIDKMLEERFGIDSAFKRTMIKRKIDPAVLMAFDEMDSIDNTCLRLLKAYSNNSTEKSNTENEKGSLLEKYIGLFIDDGKEEEKKKQIFTVEYDVDGIKDQATKRYARHIQGKEDTYVCGDLRTWMQKIKDKIFAPKIEAPEVEVVENPPVKTSKKDDIIDIDTEELVDHIDLDFKKALGSLGDGSEVDTDVEKNGEER